MQGTERSVSISYFISGDEDQASNSGGLSVNDLMKSKGSNEQDMEMPSADPFSWGKDVPDLRPSSTKKAK